MNTQAEVERRLRLRIPTELWHAAERAGYVGAFEAAVTPAEEREALRKLSRFIKIQQKRRKPKQGAGGVYSTTALSLAYAAMQAREVSELASVAQHGDALYPLRVLREQYLRGAFVAVDGVRDWIQQHLLDGQPLPSTRLQIVAEAESRVLEALQQGQPVQLQPSEVVRVEQSCETLHYAGRVYPVRFDGALWQLWQASRALMRLCGWTENDAIEFALCNRVPEGVSLEYRAEWNLPAGLAFLSVRVPLYTRPEEVAQLYAQVRRGFKRKARYKGVSEFTARFVRFVETYRLQYPRASWKEVIREWNRQHAAEPIDAKRARVLITCYNRTLSIISRQAAVEAWSD